MIARNSTDHGGGGIGTYQANLDIYACEILDNCAGSYGGGLSLSRGDDGTEISNCLLAGNEALDFAGGVYLGHTPVSISNCTVTGNVSSGLGGGVLTAGNMLTIVNSILSGDIAPTAPEIYVWYLDHSDLAADVTVSYSNVELGAQAVFVEDGSSLVWAEGNIDSDPLFSNPHTGVYRLLPGSPCIDAGDNDSVPLDTLDVDEDGDTDEPIPNDLDGQPRFVDDPDTPDTGNGAPPIVDMGAYEFNCIDTDGDGKIALCHRVPGNPHDARSIIVSVNAVAGHLSHGDQCGPCDEDSTDDALRMRSLTKWRSWRNRSRP